MGNAENKGRLSPTSQSHRSHFRRLVDRFASGTRSTGRPIDGCGILEPFTDHDGKCPVCIGPCEVLLRFSPCSHMACTTCWLTFICTELESFAMAHLTCIACKERLAASTVINMLAAATRDTAVTTDGPNFQRALDRFEEFILRQALSQEPNVRWCPSGCGYGLIALGFQACPQLFCPRPECHGRSFCYNCQRPWSTSGACESDGSVSPNTVAHVCLNTSDNRNEAVEGLIAFLGLRQMSRKGSVPGDRNVDHLSKQSATRTVVVDAEDPGGLRFVDGTSTPSGSLRIPVSGSVSGNDSPEQLRRTSDASPDSDETGVKACPACKSLIQKENDGSCNSMNCPICGTNFCWLCLQPIKSGHFLSLSGCTVWGKQRLTRKRRVCFLVGALLGTPLIITLCVTLGIPIGIIAIIRHYCSAVAKSNIRNKHLRRFAVFLTGLGSLIVAPIETALLAVIVIPAFLGYIYFYLPCTILSSLSNDPSTPASLKPEEVATYAVES